MKVRLASLSLLVPAVVLAQPVPQALSPQPSVGGDPQINRTKAASALGNAKKQAEELKSNSSPNEEGGKCDTYCSGHNDSSRTHSS